MSEAAMDDIFHVNWDCVGEAGVSAARGVCESFFDAYGGDVSKWTPQVYREFTSQLAWWVVQRSKEATDDRLNRLLGEVDEIPF